MTNVPSTVKLLRDKSNATVFAKSRLISTVGVQTPDVLEPKQSQIESPGPFAQLAH